jgi:hypothetical protein
VVESVGESDSCTGALLGVGIELKPGAKAGLKTEIGIVVRTDVSAVEAETGTEGDVGTGAARAKFRIRFKTEVIIGVRAEIGKASTEVVAEVGVGAVSVFGIDRVTEAGRTRGGRDAKSGTEFKAGGIVETGVGAEARTGIGIVEAYTGGAAFRFVRTASCRAVFSRVRKGSRLEVC